jgi:DNA repair exonuclease SbcCD nuclease subunit
MTSKKSQLFKKAACFTDIHFGLKHNSRQHNDDCERFVLWFIEQAKQRGCETCFFLGDWHHHRANVNVSTLNYTVSNLSFLNDAFEKVYFIAGNHDLYYREKREIHSLPMAKKFPNIQLIDDTFIDGDVAILPWLVGNEWKKIEKIKTKYMFGHFELPSFYMNALVEMPDHGGLAADHFKHQDYVFSGHFHKRQQRGKIHYIGNPFGHNYADIWDFDRGAMFLEWGEEPEYVNWADGPRYISLDLSTLLEEPEKYLNEHTHAKVTLDVDISYEEANFLRETFVENFKIRELRLIPRRDDDELNVATGDIKFETVDQIVTDQLNAIDSQSYDKGKLISLYNEL